MKILNILIVALIAVLSITAGAAKAMQSPQEMEFLQSFGLSVVIIFSFGALSRHSQLDDEIKW